MNKTILYILVICFIGCRALPHKHPQSTVNGTEIHFQDFFKNDTISVFINNCLIIKDRIIKSNESTGYAGVRIVISDSNSVMLGKKKIDLSCDLKLKSTIKIEVILNGSPKKFTVNTNKGKYIGFNKYKNKVKIDQSIRKFFYD